MIKKIESPTKEVKVIKPKSSHKVINIRQPEMPQQLKQIDSGRGSSSGKPSEFSFMLNNQSNSQIQYQDPNDTVKKLLPATKSKRASINPPPGQVAGQKQPLNFK